MLKERLKEVLWTFGIIGLGLLVLVILFAINPGLAISFVLVLIGIFSAILAAIPVIGLILAPLVVIYLFYMAYRRGREDAVPENDRDGEGENNGENQADS